MTVTLKTVALPPNSTPLVGTNGRPSHHWYLWFQQVYASLGGGQGGSVAVPAANGDAAERFACADATAATDATNLRTAQAQIRTLAGSAGGSVTPGASPWTYTPAANGSLALSGGTVSAVALVRGSVTATLATSGLFPLRAGDGLKITYSAAPTAVWFPD